MSSKQLSNNKGVQAVQDSSYHSNGLQQCESEREVGWCLVPSYPSYLDVYRCSPSGELHIHFGWMNHRAVRSGSIRDFPADYCIVLGKSSVAESYELNGKQDIANEDFG